MTAYTDYDVFSARSVPHMSHKAPSSTARPCTTDCSSPQRSCAVAATASAAGSHHFDRRYPKLLWLNLEQRTRTTVGCLVGFGINNGGLRRVLTHAPRVLAQTLPQINTRFTFVQRVLGGSVQVGLGLGRLTQLGAVVLLSSGISKARLGAAWGA